MKLAKYVTLDECLASATANKNGIDNTQISMAEIDNLRLPARIVSATRIHFGLPAIITSGWRGEELSKLLGSKTSDHRYGKAIDFFIRGVSTFVVAKWIAKEFAGEFDQLILEMRGNMFVIHVGVRETGNRGEIMWSPRSGVFEYWDGVSDFKGVNDER